jgi:nicotinamidase-related amidase
MPAEREPAAHARNVALVLIDFQRDFCEEGGYMDRLGGVAFAKEAIARARLLLDAARGRGLFVVHTREGYAPDLSDCTVQRRLRSERGGAPIGARGPLGRLLIRGERGHGFVDSLTPAVGEVVIEKASYGAFLSGLLEEELRRRGIEHLFFAGVTADVCVHTTLREAIDRGFFCHYVKDAISTLDADLRRACERMVEVEGGIWGRLLDSETAIEEFSALPAGPQR